MLVIYKHKRPAPGVINNRTEENRLLRRRSQSRAQPVGFSGFIRPSKAAGRSNQTGSRETNRVHAA